MAYNEENSRAVVLRLQSLATRLSALSIKIQFDVNKGALSGEVQSVAEAAYNARNVAQELEFALLDVSGAQGALDDPGLPGDAIPKYKQRLENAKSDTDRKTKRALRIEKESESIYNQYRDFKGSPVEEEKKKEEPKQKPEKKTPAKKVAQDTATPAEKFNNITKEADRAIKKFNEKIPATQKATYEELMLELKRLDLKDGNIKTTVANLKIIQSIKNKLTRLILNDEYLGDVKEFVASFNEVAKLQNDYWKSVESKFKPGPLLREIKLSAISDAVTQLTESGIGANISDVLTDILRQNITAGGSYKALQNQLLEALTDTNRSDGLLTRYSKQITNDSIQQYNRQYTQQVAAGLNMDWFAYQGSDIKGTRPFCDALTDIRYFHQSEVPRLLRAEDLYYMKDGKRTKVPIYARTGLPHGLIEGTNPENFFVRAGGYNCGHSIRPVPERNVPIEVRDRVYNTPAYHRWKATQ